MVLVGRKEKKRKKKKEEFTQTLSRFSFPEKQRRANLVCRENKSTN